MKLRLRLRLAWLRLRVACRRPAPWSAVFPDAPQFNCNGAARAFYEAASQVLRHAEEARRQGHDLPTSRATLTYGCNVLLFYLVVFDDDIVFALNPPHKETLP